MGWRFDFGDAARNVQKPPRGKRDGCSLWKSRVIKIQNPRGGGGGWGDGVEGMRAPALQKTQAQPTSSRGKGEKRGKKLSGTA